MTTFDQLQAGHQQLLGELSAPVDAAAFLDRVKAYIDQVCEAAQDVPAPRDRDQLRANLRFWASYVYDRTGVYPRTTLRPASSSSGSAAPAPPPQPAAAPAVNQGSADVKADQVTVGGYVTRSDKAERPVAAPARARRALVPLLIAILCGVTLIVASLVLAVFSPGAISPATPAPAPTATPTPLSTRTPQPSATGSAQALAVEAREITSGPSPFDAQAWVVRMQLAARGGNGAYIFWVNGVRLPDVAGNEFTVEGKGCGTEKREIGVTSGGAAAKTVIDVKSPLKDCP